MKIKKLAMLFSLAALATTAIRGGELLVNADFSQLNADGLPKKWEIRDNVKQRSSNIPAATVRNNILTLHGGDKAEVFAVQYNLPLKAGRKYWVSFRVKAERPASYRVYSQWQEKKDGKTVWRGTNGNWQPTGTDWKEHRFEINLPVGAQAPYLAINASGDTDISFRNIRLDDETIKIVATDKLAVFSPTAQASFEIINPAAIADSYAVVDFYGKEHARGTLPPQVASKITLSPLPLGYYELRTTKLTLPFAVIPQPEPATAVDRNQFGAMVVPHTHYPREERERDAEFMKRIGIRWVRTHRINWIHVQKTPERPFNWQEADADVAMYQRYGLKIVATTCWPTPAWASSGNGTDATVNMKSLMTPAPEFIPQLQRFCREMASRYRGQIGYYEIGNEVDATNFWQGKAANSQAGDKAAILKDYCDYFVQCAKAIREGDSNAMIAPNTTGAVPEGHTYKPWLETFYRSGAAKEMNVFSTHYLADMDAIRKVMKEHGKTVDIIFTEIGGLVRTEKNLETMENFRKIIKITYVQFGTQLSKGGKAMCKFLLREIRGVHEGWVAGMLDENFRIRPEYVAYATMIRMLAEAESGRELNITGNTDSGWVQGFAFAVRGKTVNLIMLQDTTRGNVILNTPDQEVTVTDVMGRSRTVKTENGRLKLAMEQEFPLFVTGTIKDAPGPVVHPQPRLVKSIKLNLTNAGFEKTAEPNRIPGWALMRDEIKGNGHPENTFKVSTDPQEKTEGRQSLRTEASQRTNWWGVLYDLPMNQIPRPGPGQYVEFVIKYHLKGKEINGIGTGVTLAFRRKDMHRVEFSGGNWERGTFDWTKKTLTAKYAYFHPEAERITLEFTMGKATGTSWHDDVEVTVNLWQKSGAEARNIN